MFPQSQERTLLSAVTPVAITSSTDATPIVVTATAHGLTTGQRVFIYNHATNIAANGIKLVTVLTSNTFSLQGEIAGNNIAGSGAGAGSGGYVMLAPPVMLSKDFKTIVVQAGTTGTATLALGIFGSNGRPEAQLTSPRYDYPDMGATVSPTNPWSLLNIVNLLDGSNIPGSTGIVAAGGDINGNWEVNINRMKYVTVAPISWTAGVITVKVLLVSST